MSTSEPLSVSATELLENDPSAVQVFDFSRPSKLNRDSLRNLEMIHETFAGHVGTLLSSSLRSVCSFTVASIEELSYEAYITSLPALTQMVILSMEPLPGFAMFQMSIEGAMSIIEMLLGGSGAGPHPERPFTDLEEALMRKALQQVFAELASAFSPVIDLQTRMIGFESNPQFVQLVSRTEVVVSVSFRLRIAGFDEANVTICYPYPVIHPILTRIPRSGAVIALDPVSLDRVRGQMAELLTETDVDVAVGFSSITMRGADLVGLGVGDIVSLGHEVEKPLNASVGGLPLLEVEPVKKGKRAAARVVARIDNSTIEDRENQ